MTNEEKLYDAFGELIYILAIADGVIQPQEVKKLEEIIARHPFKDTIKWSFNYEVKSNNNIEDLYKKVIDTCQEYGATDDYKFLIKIMEEVAETSDGIIEKESDIIFKFTEDLTDRLKKDLEKLLA